MRVAFFSDVHSNLPALEAVLDDIAAAGVDARYALGDLVGYAPWPNEVIERLKAEGIPGVMGNYDEGTGFDMAECGCAYTDPVEKAAPGTIRGDFALITQDNLVHGSDSPESAAREIELWFPDA